MGFLDIYNTIRSYSNSIFVPKPRTYSQITETLTPLEGQVFWDSDNKCFRFYDPSNPRSIEERYIAMGLSNDGNIKVNGYYDNAVSCTFTSSINVVNAVSHGLANDTPVAFKSNTGTLPLEIYQDKKYYVINTSPDNYQISESVGGSAVEFTTDGTSGTVFYDMSGASTKPSFSITADNYTSITYPSTAKLDISSVTSFPKNNTILDSNFYNYSDNKFLENNIDRQSNEFRIRATFTKSSVKEVHTATFRLYNPLSGFYLTDSNTILKKATSGELTFKSIKAIADDNSIGKGYQFQITCTDDLTGVEIVDITRFCNSKTNPEQ